MPTVLLPRLTVSDIDNCPTVVDIDDVANHIFVCDHCWNSVEALFFKAFANVIIIIYTATVCTEATRL